MKLNTSIIADFVEAMLPRFSDPNLCLYMRFQYSCSSGKKTHHSVVSVLFQRPSNYTKVLVNYDEDNHLYDLGKEIEWKLLSDHDSCWKSDGLRFFEMFLPNIRHKDYENICFSVSGNPRYVLLSKFDLKRDERKCIIQFEKELDVRTVSEYMKKAIDAGW